MKFILIIFTIHYVLTSIQPFLKLIRTIITKELSCLLSDYYKDREHINVKYISLIGIGAKRLPRESESRERGAQVKRLFYGWNQKQHQNLILK